MSAARDAALFFLARGWVPVAVAARGKMPASGPGWQHLRPTAADVKRWPADGNAGVLLGSASGGLTDLDLDCAEAIALAPFYLPSTWVFGRPSKPRSHWLYVCQGAQSHKFTDEKKATLLEIRSETAAGPGHQTVMPPSVHTSGERIEWDPDLADGADGTDGPRVIEWRELVHRVADLARGTLKMREGATAAEARAWVASYKPEPYRPAPPRPRPTSTSDLLRRARSYIARMPAAISGAGGHDATMAVALALVQGFALDEGDARQLLAEFNERCQPPWSERELEHKLQSAIDASRVPTGYLLDGARRQA